MCYDFSFFPLCPCASELVRAGGRQSVMKRLSSYEPFNKMADAVLYGGIVALTFGSNFFLST